MEKKVLVSLKWEIVLFVYSNIITMHNFNTYMWQKLSKIVKVHQNPNKYYEPVGENIAAEKKKKKMKV